MQTSQASELARKIARRLFTSSEGWRGHQLKIIDISRGDIGHWTEDAAARSIDKILDESYLKGYE